MATAITSFVDGLEAQLTCVICNDIFTEPRSLPCLHTFCFECIKNWSDACQRQRQPLKCPTCRAAVKVEDGDVSKLPSSFTYNLLLQLFQALKATSDIQQQNPECVSCNKHVALTAFCPQCEGMICGDCINNHKTMRTLKKTHQATLLSEFKIHNVNSYINNKSLCKEKFHEECRLEYYCKTCRKCVCHKCAATGHSSHDKVSIEEAAEDAKKLIGKDMQDLDELLGKFKSDLKGSNEDFREFKCEIDTGKDKARCHTRAMIKILQDRENATIAAFDNKLEQRAKEHEDEQRDINANIHQIAELKHQCEAMANEQLEHYVLESYENLQQVCNATFQDKSAVLRGQIKLNSSVYYKPNAEVIPIIQNLEFGEVVVSVTDPSRCSIESLSDARCGFINEFKIVTRNSAGNVCHTNTSKIDVQIHGGDGECVKKELVETQTGKYLVRYKAEKLSPYKVVVVVGGKEIQNSPQNVDTIDAKPEFKPIMLVDLKEMTQPCELAVSDRGDIAVTNSPISNDSRVFLFNTDGEYLRCIGGKEAGKNQLFCPSAVLFNKDQLVIADIDPDRQYGILKEFDINGTYKKTICTLTKKVFAYAMCTANRNIACLCYNHNNKESFVKILDKHNFDHLRDIKLDVPNDGHEHPLFLAYGNNKIFVKFYRKDTVYVFDENGCLLSTFGENGTNDGQFRILRGLAVFGEEMLLACDSDNHRVQLFNQDGHFIRSFGICGSALGQMNWPVAINVSPDGRVFVLEVLGKRLQIFEWNFE